MREQLQSISLDVSKVNAARETEMAEREKFLSTLRQFTTAFQKRTADFINLAAELHIRSDARLSDISESLGTGFGRDSQPEVGTSKSPAAASPLNNVVDDECRNMS